MYYTTENENYRKYGIVILDELDRGFSDNTKYKFIEILGTQIRRIGINQVFMVSHNYSYYEGYDLGYICFPGSNLTNKDSNSIIKIEQQKLSAILKFAYIERGII